MHVCTASCIDSLRRMTLTGGLRESCRSVDQALVERVPEVYINFCFCIRQFPSIEFRLQSKSTMHIGCWPFLSLSCGHEASDVHIFVFS